MLMIKVSSLFSQEEYSAFSILGYTSYRDEVREKVVSAEIQDL